ncbi:MAG TPA: hypothetical protein DIT07_12525 [Sphingobacteriaceae bacterium]|nr:hypothetical protein [Sphingobacteriaceae bacterium]
MTTQIKNLSIRKRITSPTPKFFKKIRCIGLILGAVGVGVLTSPVSLPALVTTLAGYLATAGAVAASVSSAAVESQD